MRRLVFFVILFCSLNIWTVESATFRGEVKIDIVEGRKVHYCEYKGLKLLPKSKFKDYEDCRMCKCTKSGLDCSTYPYIPRSVQLPADAVCRPITVGCKIIWVRKDRPMKKCPKRLIPAGVSAVGK